MDRRGSKIGRGASDFSLSGRFLAAGAFATLSFSTVSPAAAAEEPNPGSGLPEAKSEEREPLPPGVGDLLLRERPACDYREHLSVERHVFVACGRAGLWVVLLGEDGSTKLERQEVGGVVTGLKRAGVAVLPIVEVRRRESPDEEPLTPTVVEPRVETPVRSSSPAPAPVGYGPVLGVDGARVRLALDFGRPNVGDRVEFSKGGATPIIGEVERVEDDEVFVWVGTNEVVDRSHRAEATLRGVTRDVVGPPLSEAAFVVAAMVRPWFGGVSGSGVFLSGMAEARFGWMRVAVDLGPFNAPIQNDAYAGSAALRWGAASRYFEGGLGLGISSINRNYFYAPGTGLLFAPYLRVGAEDGFMIRIDAGAAIFHSRNQFSYLNALVQVPILQRVALTVGGGGGDVGYGFFESGVRVLGIGNGGVGSWFFRGTIGYVGVERPSSSGPFLGFGAEHRF